MPSDMYLALVAGLAAIALIPWLRLSSRRPDLAVAVIVATAAYSSLLFAALYQAGLPAASVRALIAFKDALGITLLVVLLFRTRRTRVGRIVAAMLAVATALLAAGLLMGHGISFTDRAVGLRAFLVPLVAPSVAALLPINRRHSALRLSFWVIAFAGLMALIEYALPVRLDVTALHVGDYWTYVKQQSGALVYFPRAGGLLPGNWFTGAGVRRLAGPFGDPLSAGYMLAVAAAIACLTPLTSVDSRRRRLAVWAALVIVLGALALSFTRAGWMLAFGAALGYIGRKVIRHPGRGRASALGAGAATAVVLAALMSFGPWRSYVTDVFSGHDSSTIAHSASLSANLHRHYPAIGTGIGSTGGAVASRADSSAIFTESTFSTAILSMGTVAGGAYLLLLSAGISACASHARRTNPRSLMWLLPVLGLAVTCVVSEELLTFNAGWTPAFVFTAGLLTPALPAVEVSDVDVSEMHHPSVVT